MTTPDALPQALTLAVHEVRTPLSIASGYLRLLLRADGDPLTDQQRGMLEKASFACARISALVAEMNELSGVVSNTGAADGQELSLTALVRDLVSTFAEGRDRGVIVEPRISDRPIRVIAHRRRTTRLLEALIRSAVHEREGPGAIVVFCDVLLDDAVPWAVFAVGDEATVRSLLDAASDPPRAFDEWGSGHGLAVPIGRRAIEALGGRLWSAAGDRPRGSALRLPLLDREAHDA